MKTSNPLICKALRTFPVPGRYLDTVLRVAGVAEDGIATPALVSDRWKSFSVLIDNLHDPIERHIYFQGYFEWKETQFVRKCLHAGDIVFDVGANIGWYTLLAAAAVRPDGKVFAFEPHPASRQRLVENCAFNQFDNVRVFDFAVGRGDSVASLRAGARKDIGGASLFLGDEETVDDHAVQVRTLDGIIDDLGITRARLCKMDIEGSEVDALEGMQMALRRKVFDFILIEINAVALERAGRAPRDIITVMRSSGYRVSDVRTPGVELSDIQPFGNYVCACR